MDTLCKPQHRMSVVACSVNVCTQLFWTCVAAVCLECCSLISQKIFSMISKFQMRSAMLLNISSGLTGLTNSERHS